ncbi:MAG: squalene/phytoene synthase family protein, partial [Gammaproteobacteria bacterium]|nr:squalene/phytoene synthase family protein [Gammaproteobacteria bacterium]
MNEVQTATGDSKLSPQTAKATAGPSAADLALQDSLLPGVSRTFALTIPQLPEPLRVPVTNAYLLCRIADTIEDEPTLSPEDKQAYHDQFVDAVNGKTSATEFARSLYPRLSAATLPAERELILHAQQVLHTTRALPKRQREALQRCVSIMCDGMTEFQNNEGREGLEDLREMERYCYFVAGVVGEMLTELFCDYSTDIESSRKELMDLAV